MSLCIPIQGPTVEEIRNQIMEATLQANVLELRIDLFDDQRFETIKSLKELSSLPPIFTVRKKSQGGAFKGTEEQRLALIQEIATLNPAFLDIEYDVPSDYVQKIRKHTKVILSFHDFSQTPLHLNLPTTPADCYKIATYANSTLDSLRLLEFIREYPSSNLSVMGMGSEGEITRILGKVFGSQFIYASLNESLSTAPGQITAKALKEIYHWDLTNKNTSLYGLIGDPVTHTISHFSHNKVMEGLKIPAVYVRMLVKPQELCETVRKLVHLGWKGISVTMPHKESIIGCIDEVDPEAADIGAVNTLYVSQGKICGKNTDGIGLVTAVKKYLDLKGKTVVLLGAGGAAKAIAHFLYKSGASLIIVNRTQSKGEELAAKYNGKAIPQLENEKYDLLINTVPTDITISWVPGTFVMDIRTKITSFLKEAKQNGCHIIQGYKMFIYQAVEQYNVWFPGINKKIVEDIIEKVASEIYKD